MPLKRTLNYDDRLFLNSVISVCQRRGEDIQVGYDGGETRLRADVKRYGAERLRTDRELKIRYPKTNEGVIVESNWISGPRFLQLLVELRVM